MHEDCILLRKIKEYNNKTEVTVYEGPFFLAYSNLRTCTHRMNGRKNTDYKYKQNAQCIVVTC